MRSRVGITSAHFSLVERQLRPGCWRRLFGWLQSHAVVQMPALLNGRVAVDGRSREVTNGSFVAAKLTEDPRAQWRLRGSPDARSGSAALDGVRQLSGCET